MKQKYKKESKSLKERGLHEDSFFEIEFEDGSKETEHSLNWSEISEFEEVKYPDGTKKVYRVCKYPLSNIKVFHHKMNHSFKPEKDERVYQAIYDRVTFLPGDKKVHQNIGRILGIINKKGEVVKEVFLNNLTNEVVGFHFKQ